MDWRVGLWVLVCGLVFRRGRSAPECTACRLTLDIVGLYECVHACTTDLFPAFLLCAPQTTSTSDQSPSTHLRSSRGIAASSCMFTVPGQARQRGMCTPPRPRLWPESTTKLTLVSCPTQATLQRNAGCEPGWGTEGPFSITSSPLVSFSCTGHTPMSVLLRLSVPERAAAADCLSVCACCQVPVLHPVHPCGQVGGAL
jgi:hypothetical protein